MNCPLLLPSAGKRTEWMYLLRHGQRTSTWEPHGAGCFYLGIDNQGRGSSRFIPASPSYYLTRAPIRGNRNMVLTVPLLNYTIID